MRGEATAIRPISERGWIGFDLDGTLAEYHGWPKDGGIGKPIPKMVEFAKKCVERMHRGDMAVRIFTARICPIGRPTQNDCAEQKQRIEEWCKEHLGEVLPVVYEKDFRMVTLYDDRCESVEANTGITDKDRIAELESALMSIRKYLYDHEDVEDALCDGAPRPNWAIRMAQDCASEFAKGRRR